MSNFDHLQKYFDEEVEVEAKCDLCKKLMGVADTFELAKWVLHYNCYHIALKRLEPFIDILFGPEDEFQKWLDGDKK